MEDIPEATKRSIKQSQTDLRHLNVSASTPSHVFSRSLQRKLEALLKCDFLDAQCPSVAMRLALSVAERSLVDLIHCLQSQQSASISLWAAIRSHGCQFLGPAMQEEVLRLILLALEDGSSLSRRVLVLFIVQRLQCQFPQASKTAVGHVIQLLYRGSCFNVIKREDESSLMQLKEELRNYESLRFEHDMQIVKISLDFGLRIGPEQWSCLLYGDSNHKSQMQSIIDKLSKRQTLTQSREDLLAILNKSNELQELSTELKPQLDLLVHLQENSLLKSASCSWIDLDSCLKAVLEVVGVVIKSLCKKQALHDVNLSTLQYSDEVNDDHLLSPTRDQYVGTVAQLSPSSQEYGNKTVPDHYNEPVYLGQMTSEFSNDSPTVDDVFEISASLRSCNLSCMPREDFPAPVSTDTEGGIHPITSCAGFPDRNLQTYMSYSLHTGTSFPLHHAPQSQYVPVPGDMISDITVPMPLSGNCYHSPFMPRFHNSSTSSEYM